MAVNVLGTWHVLLAAEAAGVTRVICFSSAQVFGIAEGERLPGYFPVDDAHPRRAMRPYGLSKRLAEDLCEGFTARTGITTVSLRPVAVWDEAHYSRVRDQWHAQPRSEWEPFWEYGAFVDVRDVAAAVRRALTVPLAGHHRALLCAADIAATAPSLELASRFAPGVRNMQHHWRHCQSLVTQSGQEADVIRMFLIRHGESESNAGLPSADPGSAPLTPVGHRQARQIARILADVPALIVTSPYLRSRQTAQPTISRFPQAACQEWPVQEFTYLGDLHGRTSTAAERQPHARAYWDQADPHHASPGAESFTGLLRRTADFLDRLSAQRPGPVMVFTHGLFMRAVAWSLLTGITTPGQEQMRSFRRFANHYLIPNAGVIELRQAGHDLPSLLGGSTIHLPAALAQRSR